MELALWLGEERGAGSMERGVQSSEPRAVVSYSFRLLVFLSLRLLSP